jgi:hypothetical protein
MIRRIAKLLIPRELQKLIIDGQMTPFRLAALERRVEMLASNTIRQRYEAQAIERVDLPLINRHEFSVYSQNGEDGILLFLFSIIGTSSRRFIEFGIGDGRECNSANLLINFAWNGVLLDCMPQFVNSARKYYDHMLRDRARDVTIVETMITAENVNDILTKYHPIPDVDLITIDVDGNDYWIWKNLEAFKPRVLVIEYAAVMGPHRSITVAYSPEFSRFEKHPSGLYAGASLSALVKLAAEKGYTFVGCNVHGVNAFFVRSDLVQRPLEQVTATQGYFEHLHPGLAHVTPGDFAQISHLPFVEV